MSADPVHQDEDGRWYFYNETWSELIGPYDSRDAAAEACRQYAEWLQTG